ncbi:MAG TPA: methylated-DNA--[protein]-cysteine S-methyltransferase [Phnomibacter sp.]|nr:methylated-DNA--[protein]-cysteine S-methyltransferase [Phnomibacter sp.]
MSNTWQTYMQTPVGNLLVETDGAAITCIHFLEDDETVTPTDHPLLQQAVTELEAYFAGSLKTFSFPMAQQGTEFQQRVWNMLGTIPLGTTISYKTLAIQLGDEKCIRAAGTANGKNQLAIVVPCHRVIGSNGELVGYAGGMHRKKWLLEHEAKMSGHAVQGEMRF